MLILHVNYKIHNGNPRDFLESLKECGIVSKSRLEKGNLLYEYFFPENNPSSLFLIEKWDSEEVFSKHIDQPHFKAAAAMKEKFNVETVIEKFIV